MEQKIRDPSTISDRNPDYPASIWDALSASQENVDKLLSDVNNFFEQNKGLLFRAPNAFLEKLMETCIIPWIESLWKEVKWWGFLGNQRARWYLRHISYGSPPNKWREILNCLKMGKDSEDCSNILAFEIWNGTIGRIVLKIDWSEDDKLQLIESTIKRIIEAHKGVIMEALIAFLNGRLEEQMFDELTGLLTRKWAITFIRQWMEIYGQAKVKVLFLDLNDFKSVNDSLGHNWGDIALGLFADAMKKAIREEDLVIRWGGDEFMAVVLAGDSWFDSEEIKKRIKANMLELLEDDNYLKNKGYLLDQSSKDRIKKWINGENGPVTVSEAIVRLEVIHEALAKWWDLIKQLSDWMFAGKSNNNERGKIKLKPRFWNPKYRKSSKH